MVVAAAVVVAAVVSAAAVDCPATVVVLVYTLSPAGANEIWPRQLASVPPWTVTISDTLLEPDAS